MGAHACRIFGTLTGGAGDIELVMTLDKHVLFSEGILLSVRSVRLHCRPVLN